MEAGREATKEGNCQIIRPDTGGRLQNEAEPSAVVEPEPRPELPEPELEGEGESESESAPEPELEGEGESESGGVRARA